MWTLPYMRELFIISRTDSAARVKQAGALYPGPSRFNMHDRGCARIENASCLDASAKKKISCMLKELHYRECTRFCLKKKKNKKEKKNLMRNTCGMDFFMLSYYEHSRV